MQTMEPQKKGNKERKDQAKPSLTQVHSAHTRAQGATTYHQRVLVLRYCLEHFRRESRPVPILGPLHTPPSQAESRTVSNEDHYTLHHL